MEALGSYINEAHGSVHSGDGPQYNNYYLQAGARLREQATRRTRSVAKEDRDHLDARFVSPPGLQRARNRLRESHTVLLDGVPGGGRRAAALMLLHELPDGRGSLHELPDTVDDADTPLLDLDDIGDDDRILLDLSEADAHRFLAVQSALSDFRSGLLARNAHLAVVLPHQLDYLMSDQLKRLVVELGRPPAHRVLVRHLRCTGITPEPGDLDGPALTSYLTRAPLRDVAGLAHRISRRRDDSPPDRGLPHWLAASLAEQHDQTARVAADLSISQDGRRRALLLSLAMFHGAAPGVVLHTTNALLRAVSHPPDTTPRLDRTDLYADLAGVGAEVHPDGLVRFGIPGYDRAVREHFWTFLPDLHQKLRTWFRDSLADPSVPAEVRVAAVARYSAECLRTARPEDLTWLAEQWTSPRAPARLIEDASQALARGLESEPHGRFFRQRIYEWCTSPDTGRALQQVLVLVCSRTMPGSHPDQALVRLHHLARRTRGQVAADAQAALLHLGRSEPRLYRTLLDRLAAGVGHTHGLRDLALFLELADPRRLLGHPAVRASLATCWAEALRLGPDSWEPSARRWLDAAVDLRARTAVLRVLAAACATDIRGSGHLYRVARGWLLTAPGAAHADTVSQLLLEIDAAQGIEPYALTG
jgi:hypothetical protein